MAQANLLKKVNARIKALKRTGMSHDRARDQAWKEYRSGKKVSGTRAAAVRPAAKKVSKKTTVKKTTTVKLAGMSGVAMEKLNKTVGDISWLDRQIADLMGSKHGATAAEKKRISGEIVKAKKQKAALQKLKTAYKGII